MRLGVLEFGDVAEDDSHAVGQREQPVGEPARAYQHGHAFATHRRPARHGAEEGAPEVGVRRPWEDFPQHPADHVAGGTTEVTRRLAVEVGDPPIAVDRIKAFADPFEDRSQLGLTLLFLAHGAKLTTPIPLGNCSWPGKSG